MLQKKTMLNRKHFSEVLPSVKIVWDFFFLFNEGFLLPLRYVGYFNEFQIILDQ